MLLGTSPDSLHPMVFKTSNVIFNLQPFLHSML